MHAPLLRRAVTTGAVLVAVLSGPVVGAVVTAPAAAAPGPTAATASGAGVTTVSAPAHWADVALAAHDYGRLTAPSSLVATAGAGLFRFTSGEQGAADGPHSVAIAPDGSVWTVGSTGFVIWAPGSVRSPRTLPAPAGTVLDLAIGADGTVWSTVIVQGPQRLVAQSPDGTVRRQVPYGPDEVPINAPLRFGADHVLYVETGTNRWIPLTGPTGDPLPVADQLRSVGTGIPVTAGQRLAWTTPSPHEVRYVLLGANGAPVGGWRLTSATDEITPYRSTSTLLGGDLVTTLSTARTTAAGQQVGHELVTVRITPAGRLTARVTTSASAVWGDWTEAPRPGPDGALYQLRTSPTAGVQVWRYALTATAASRTSTAANGSAAGTATASPTATVSPAATTSGAAPTSGAASPTPSTATDAPTGRAVETAWTGPRLVIVGVGVVAAAVLLGLGVRRVARERRRP